MSEIAKYGDLYEFRGRQGGYTLMFVGLRWTGSARRIICQVVEYDHPEMTLAIGSIADWAPADWANLPVKRVEA